MKESVFNWVSASLYWSHVPEDDGKNEVKTACMNFKISKGDCELTASRIWKDHGNEGVFSLNIQIPSVPPDERDPLRRAFVQMVADAYAGEQVEPTVVDNGLNLKFQFNNCTFKSKWSEEAGLVKFKVKVKRNPRQ
jgi:hypothetical protein